MQEEFILGINGWHVKGHDASASLIRCKTDGSVEMVAAAEEERFNGVKHAYDTLPYKAVKFCLDTIGIRAEDLSAVAIPFEYPKIYADRGLNFNITDAELKRQLFPSLEKQDKPEIVYVNHHLAHVLSAFSPSMMESSVVMIVDGQGENESTTLWIVRNSGSTVQKISFSGIESSLGYFYEALTEFVGFKSDETGKTMGIAPYGNPNKYKKHLEEIIKVDDCVVKVLGSEVKLGLQSVPYFPVDEQHQVRSFWLRKFSEVTGLIPNDNSRRYSFRNFPKDYRDLAAAGQGLVETVLLTLAQQARLRSAENDLCISGGVGLNCVANGKIVETGVFRRVYVQPASNDAGTSLGAALEIAREKGYSVGKVHMIPYLGLGFSDADIVNFLKRSNVDFLANDDASNLIADLVVRGKVVGLFQGRAEFGPRALGNRSYIADPRTRHMQNYLNQFVKDREDGRPLAPSLIDSESANFFGRKLEAPHMTVAYRIADGLEAITHVDHSARPQIVDEYSNPIFYRQLIKIKDKIGIGVVVNTSLNLHGPIINTPQQALELLEKTGAAAIAFNNKYVVMKNN